MAKKALKVIKKAKKVIEPFVPFVEKEKETSLKGPSDCVVVGCDDPIAPGQTHVCIKHQRSN